MRNRVAITGMGVLCPIGNALAEFWESLMAGRSGVGLTTKCDCSDLSSKISGEVKKFDPLKYMNPKEVKRVDISQQYAIAASDMAWEDAGLNENNYDPDRSGVIIGSGIGG